MQQVLLEHSNDEPFPFLGQSLTCISRCVIASSADIDLDPSDDEIGEMCGDALPPPLFADSPPPPSPKQSQSPSVAKLRAMSLSKHQSKSRGARPKKNISSKSKSEKGCASPFPSHNGDEMEDPVSGSEYYDSTDGETTRDDLEYEQEGKGSYTISKEETVDGAEVKSPRSPRSSLPPPMIPMEGALRLHASKHDHDEEDEFSFDSSESLPEPPVSPTVAKKLGTLIVCM